MTLASSAKKPSKTFDELMSTPIDFYEFIMNKINNLTQETLLGPAFRLLKGTRFNYAKLECDFEECYKALLEKLDWENLEGSDYPFDFTKPLPLVTNGNRQMVPVDYFFNNDLKYLQGGILTMNYTTCLTKTKSTQYDLPGIEDMVSNIWSHVKVAYDKHALWGILHWREQLTQVKIMRKHGYGYLKEIKVRRADNDLYTFKEGDFSRLFKSYQKKINITMPETTRPDIRKKDPYTPYQDPQGFIYVDTLGRNRLMRSDELYKFSDGTLTRFQTFLEDITNNIHMEYLPKKRWSTLLKKRANIMIKEIDKQLKERRMMRSLENPQVVSAAKLPILNPNEFDLWKMRIEQYFLMTDYSLWEVILNGDSPAPTRVIEGVVKPVASTTAEQRLARKNKLKAREKRFGGNKDTKKVQKTLLKQHNENFTGSSSKRLDQIHDRLQKLINLEKQSLDDLFNNLKIYKAEVKSSSSASNSTQNIAFVSSQTTENTNDPVSVVASVSTGSVKILVFALPNVDTLRDFFRGHEGILEQMDLLPWVLICQKWSVTTAIGKDTLQGSVAITRVFKQKRNQPTMPLWHLPLQVLLVLTMSLPASPIYDRYHSGDGYHDVPPPYTGTFMPPKPDLVFHNAPNVNETVHITFNVDLSPTKPGNDLSHTHRPSTPIIEDWVSDLKDNSKAEIPQNAPSFVQPIEQVKTPRPSVKTFETSIPTTNTKTTIPKPKSNANHRNKKACFVCKSLDHLIKDCVGPLTLADL
nr:hypothetical protein [Tanacetum cinerariifolium]